MAAEQPGPGTVAEEAARLVDAFAAWAGDEAGATGEPTGRSAAEPQDGAPGDPHERRGAAEGSEDGTCPDCGASRADPGPSTCRICPVCQGIALLRSVRPETVDRLADLAAAVADSLRAAARSRREDAAPPAGGGRPTSTQDIPVTETDAPEDDSDDADDDPDTTHTAETTDEGARS